MRKKDKKKVGRPPQYEGVMVKRNLRLPEYIWKWLDGLSVNRTKALIMLYNQANKEINK